MTTDNKPPLSRRAVVGGAGMAVAGVAASRAAIVQGNEAMNEQQLQIP